MFRAVRQQTIAGLRGEIADLRDEIAKLNSTKPARALKALKLQLMAVGINPPHSSQAWDFGEFQDLRDANVALKQANDEKAAVIKEQKQEIARLQTEISGQALVNYRKRLELSCKAREIVWQNTYGELAILLHR
eukprot:COSAG02_NODE_5477_length_4292_cov_13.353685_5_plen_134_part_00